MTHVVIAVSVKTALLLVVANEMMIALRTVSALDGSLIPMCIGAQLNTVSNLQAGGIAVRTNQGHQLRPCCVTDASGTSKNTSETVSD